MTTSRSIETGADEAMEEDEDEEKTRVVLNMLPVPQRMKFALKGTRSQRAVLIRDPNKVIAAAVLSSPKLTETEVEAFSRMANVSEDVLRTIGTSRAWTTQLHHRLGAGEESEDAAGDLADAAVTSERARHQRADDRPQRARSAAPGGAQGRRGQRIPQTVGN